MGVGLEFCLLGPVTVRREGVAVPVAGGKLRAVLAALLLDAGELVTVNQLAEVLWGADPPPSARVSVQNYVKRLRQALGEAGRTRIRTQPGGYVMRLEAGELDVSRFQDSLAAARAAARDRQWGQASAQASAALQLWRGEPLVGAASDLLAQRAVPYLAEIRLQAWETRLEAEVQLGHHADAIVELRRLTAAHPLREHPHALLMLALRRCGRQAEALAAYQAARRILIEELGAEPGPELRQAHRLVLADDQRAAAAPPPPAPAAGRPVTPRQLPAPVRDFVGRQAELAALTGFLDRAAASTSATLVISAIAGTAGIGKTALAVHWAHQVAGRFPDGQLYVNLRGFHPSGMPMSAAGAVRGFLDALQVPVEQIPADLDAQAALYRSLMAGRSMLVVLDNAANAAQVRPLLPGGSGCLAVVTSRSQLAGLVAAEGAQLLTLDMLTEAEACELLAGRLGVTRLGAEPEAAKELITLCARLPLALAITAARAAARPGFRLAVLAEELSDARRRLDLLETGDAVASMRAAFSWSLSSLSASAARMFALLGLHPGPDITIPAAASLTGMQSPAARRALEELTGAHLVAEQPPGRFAMHDLLRAYAAEHAAATSDDAARHAAVARVLDHYLHTASPAALLLRPVRDVIALAPPRPGAVPEQPADHRQALAWFEAEYQVLLAAVTLADSSGFDSHAWQLPWSMMPFQATRGHYQEWAVTQRTALAAATRVGDIAGQAVSSCLLASACDDLGDYDQALGHYASSLRLYQRLGNCLGEANVHQNLGLLAEHQGRYADALGHAQQALGLYETIGHKAGQAVGLNYVGWCHGLLGDYQQAHAYCRRSLALCAEAGHRRGEGHAWDSLGYAEHHLGNLPEAAACYERALAIARELGDRWVEADTLTHLGDTRYAVGDLAQAREAWEQALAIFEDIQHADAAKVSAKLGGLDAESPLPREG